MVILNIIKKLYLSFVIVVYNFKINRQKLSSKRVKLAQFVYNQVPCYNVTNLVEKYKCFIIIFFQGFLEKLRIKKRFAQLSIEEGEELAKAVPAYPCMYEKSKKECKDKIVVKNAWKEVSVKTLSFTKLMITTCPF